MNRTTVILVALAAAVTIAVTSLLTASHTSALPVPHIPVVPQVTHSGSSANRSGGGRSGSSSAGAGSSGFVPGPAPTLTGCVASVSNPSPVQGHTAETVTVTTTPDVLVSVVANYAHTRSRHDGVTPASGTITFSLPVQHAPVGVTVAVTVTASLRGQKVTCGASFTPVP
jgi:hypothetical protein